MALLTIRTMGDPILEKRAKEVKEMTPRIQELIADMLETMYDANGVGLAAPQVGILKRIAVIDISENQDEPYVFINPEIVEATGEQTGYEGCLSVPGKSGIVTRPDYVRAIAYNEDMEQIEVEGEGLFARAMAHEFDHLDGKLYVPLSKVGLLDNDALYPIDEDGNPIPEDELED